MIASEREVERDRSGFRTSHTDSHTKREDVQDGRMNWLGLPLALVQQHQKIIRALPIDFLLNYNTWRGERRRQYIILLLQKKEVH